MSAPDTTDETSRLFQDVIKSFKASLGPVEKAMLKEFGTSKEMLTDLHTRCQDVQNGRKLSKLCQKIESFASAWEPFFEITSILVQASPDYAGFAWGAIRLVFLLGTNYTAHLDKIVMMVQRIGDTLPAYEEYLKLFMSRRTSQSESSGPSFHSELRHHRLCRALSYVYADIVQFCQEACKIFGSKRGGARYKPSLVWEVFWKPFDARFSGLIVRMQSHREMFQNEVQLEEAKYLQLQNEKQAAQSELQGKHLEQILQQVKELRDSNTQMESLLSKQLDTITHAVWTEHDDNKFSTAENENTEREILCGKMTDIKAWANAPEYMLEYEKAHRTRLTATGEYLLDHRTYKDWKGYAQTQRSVQVSMDAPMLPKVLFIKGKPGFGKTILSSLIIEDLRETQIAHAGTSGSLSIFFYHFSSEKRDSCKPYHALRAILVQLIHNYRSEVDALKEIIDQLAILMDAEGSGQLTASDEEISAALSLLLAILPSIVLVFDGIDECEGYELFLEQLRDICHTIPVKILLLSRPTVQLPDRFPHLSLHLDQTWNLSDIKLFIRPKVAQLHGRRLLPPNLGTDEVVESLSSRAEGMFLWAYLMMSYLGCRALSPKEREDAIVSPKFTEGLDDVYDKICGILDRGYPKEKNRVRHIFEIIYIATRPLQVSELEVALAIVPGAQTDPANIIVDLEETLPIICGALVDVHTNRTVRFVHSSFRDFLVAPYRWRHGAFLTVQERRSHVLLSTACLSYIAYDLPSTSICRAISAKDRATAKASFPFIEYALYWTEHAAQGFDVSSRPDEKLETTVEDDFYTLLTKFLNRPLSVTVWIESSWIFQSDPSLSRLLSGYDPTTSLEPVSLMTTGSLAMTMVRELEGQLKSLSAEWKHLLRKDPQAIWGHSVTAFSRSSFWFHTKDTIVSSLVPTEAAGSYQSGSTDRPIVVKSQVSECGHELGVVLVIPSRSYLIAVDALFATKPSILRQKSVLSLADKRKLANACSCGWRIRYQRWNTDHEELHMNLEVQLPERQVFNMLQQCLASNTPHRFPFSIAISHDLTRLVILQSILTIRKVIPTGSTVAVPQHRLQCLDGEEHLQEPQSGLSNDKIAVYSSFAPDASALAFVFKKLNPGSIDTRNIRVWSATTENDGWPHFEYKGEVLSSRLSWHKETREPFAFHPYLPLLAYLQWSSTAIWRYQDSASAKGIVLEHAVNSLGFSKDGKFLKYAVLYGRERSADPDAIREGRSREDERPAKSDISLRGYSKALPESLLQELGSHANFTLAQRQIKSASITPEGAVRSGSSLIAHLPRLKDGEQTNVSLLPCAENDDWARVVWNKEAQQSYSIFDHQSPHLPSIIHRRKGTFLALDDDPRDVKRQRLL